MNVLTLTGNLGRDCRVGSAGGTSVCNFAVAMTAGYGDNKQTLWVDCAVWGKQAEGRLPEFLLKGQQVAVSGELSTREHEGKTYLQLRCNSVDLIGGRSDSAPAQQPEASKPASKPSASASQPDAFDDDIPF